MPFDQQLEQRGLPDLLREFGKPIPVKKADPRKVLADALITALAVRPKDFRIATGGLRDLQTGQLWGSMFPFIHVAMVSSSNCDCKNLRLGAAFGLVQSSRVWAAYLGWKSGRPMTPNELPHLHEAKHIIAANKRAFEC